MCLNWRGFHLAKTARYDRVISRAAIDTRSRLKDGSRSCDTGGGQSFPAEAEIWVNVVALAVYQSTVAQMKLDGVL
jgi:hypothetical protein